MALDRHSIVKRDFPMGRRGYDPEAVEAHLSALADEVDEFKRSARPRSDTLASTTSDRVRAIIEAAESSAAEIQRAAEEEARQIRDAAGTEVSAAREQATTEARQQVERVKEATGAMLQRLDSLEQEFGSLIESLRAGANRLTADLQLLQSDLGGIGSVTPGGRSAPAPALHAEPEPAPPAHGDAPVDDGAATEDEPAPGGETAETALAPALEAVEPAPEPTPEAAEFDEVVGGAEPGADPEPVGSAGDESDDAEGARLIALNMALNGTPREQTARYLSENFTLADAGGLLDEVYASVEG